MTNLHLMQFQMVCLPKLSLQKPFPAVYIIAASVFSVVSCDYGIISVFKLSERHFLAYYLPLFDFLLGPGIWNLIQFWYPSAVDYSEINFPALKICHMLPSKRHWIWWIFQTSCTDLLTQDFPFHSQYQALPGTWQQWVHYLQDISFMGIISRLLTLEKKNLHWKGHEHLIELTENLEKVIFTNRIIYCFQEVVRFRSRKVFWKSGREIL